MPTTALAKDPEATLWRDHNEKAPAWALTLRAEVFAGRAPPAVLVSESAWAGDLAASLGALAGGRMEEAESRRAHCLFAEDPGCRFRGPTDVALLGILYGLSFAVKKVREVTVSVRQTAKA